MKLRINQKRIPAFTKQATVAGPFMSVPEDSTNHFFSQGEAEHTLRGYTFPEANLRAEVEISGAEGKNSNSGATHTNADYRKSSMSSIGS